MSFKLQKGDMIDKYCIEQSLGTGGMGSVYLVRHTQLNALRAMKVLHASVAEEDPEFRERFIREAKFAAKIQHNNIVSVMDVELESDSGFSYIVMEYVDGQTLHDILQRGPISEKQAIHIVIEAAKGLAYAAENGIIHRDIKPANIMITKSGEVKLADLGIAKSVNHTGNTMNLTMEGTMIGTPAYASPEQCRCARDVDTRADIYSLGATMYEMLTGQAPFSGKNEFDIIAKVLKQMPQPIEQIVPSITPDVIKLIHKMMAKDPADRPQTMLDLLQELYQFEHPENNMLEPLQQKLIEKRAEEVAQERLSVMLKTTIRARQKKMVFFTTAGFVLVLAFSAGAFFYYKLRPTESIIAADTPQKQAEQQQLQQPESQQDLAAAAKELGVVFNKNMTVLMRFPADLNLSEYTIPQGITRIENMAFAENKALKKIVIPDTVTSIGDKAFLNCSSLEEVVLPDTITKLNSQVFSGCSSLKKLILPDSLIMIEERAFSSCSLLQTLVLPESTEYVAEDCFTRCSALKSITVPQQLIDPEKISAWGLPENCLVFSNGKEVFRAGPESLKDQLGVRFSKDGKTILRYPPELEATHYTIPEGVTGIGEKAFSGCTKLKIVIIPSSVVFIDHNAFAGVQAVKLAPENKTFVMDSAGALIDKQERRLVYFPRSYKGKYTIPESVNSVCSHVFYHCDFLTELTVPDHVEKIDDRAFSNCSSLSVLTIPGKFLESGIDSWNLPEDCRIVEFVNPKKVSAQTANRSTGTSLNFPLDTKKIAHDKKQGIQFINGDRTLSKYPSGLPHKSYVVPDGVTMLGHQCFMSTKHLEKVIFPESLLTISSNIFTGSSVKEIHLPKNLKSFSGSAFGNLKVTVSPENPNFYQSKDGVICSRQTKTLHYVPKDLQGTYVVPDEITIINTSAFYSCAGIKSIKLHNGIKEIRNDAFQGCRSLRLIQLPDNMKVISQSLFMNCSQLKYVVFPKTLTTIRSYAFYNCPELEEIRLPNGVEKIENNAFTNCRGLRSIRLPNTLILIEDGAFMGCSSLQGIVIPDSVQSIGTNAFQACQGLKSISVPAHFSKDYMLKLGLPKNCKIKRRTK